MLADVAVGSKADMTSLAWDVRFIPNKAAIRVLSPGSGERAELCACQRIGNGLVSPSRRAYWDLLRAGEKIRARVGLCGALWADAVIVLAPIISEGIPVCLLLGSEVGSI